MRRMIAAAVARDRMAALGLLAVLGVFGGSVVVFSGVIHRYLEERGRATLRAEFTTAARVTAGSPVRIDGVEVGTVTDVALGSDGRNAEVSMSVDDHLLPLYRDARAAIAWRTVLGGNYYVDLEPGTAAAGPLEADTIPATQTAAQVEIDEVLDVLGDDERDGIRTLLAETPQALADEDVLREALEDLADAAPTLEAGLEPVRGVERDADLRRLVRRSAGAVRALDAPQEPIRDVVEGAAATVTTTGRRSSEIEQIISGSARLLPEVQATMQALDTTLALADPVLARLQDPARDLEPTLAELHPTVVDAERLLARARPLVRSLRPAVASLAAAAVEGRPLLDGVEPSLRRADETILPDLAERDATSGRATYQMIGPAIAGLNGLGGGFDRLTHIANLAAQVGERNIDSGPCKTYIGDPTAEQIAKCEDILEAIGRVLTPPTTRAGGQP